MKTTFLKEGREVSEQAVRDYTKLDLPKLVPETMEPLLSAINENTGLKEFYLTTFDLERMMMIAIEFSFIDKDEH